MTKQCKRHKQEKAITQCERCESRAVCRPARQEDCAHLEFCALADGKVYVCDDFEAPYWERMCA